MNLAPGVRLGPYEIIALPGAGGMVDVWKARDTRINCLVALMHLAIGMVQLIKARFERRLPASKRRWRSVFPGGWFTWRPRIGEGRESRPCGKADSKIQGEDVP